MRLIAKIILILIIFSSIKCSSIIEESSEGFVILPSDKFYRKRIPFFESSSNERYRVILTNTTVSFFSNETRKVLWSYTMPDSLLDAKVSVYNDHVFCGVQHVVAIVSNILLRFDFNGKLVELWKINNTPLYKPFLNDSTNLLYYQDFRTDTVSAGLICLDLNTKKVRWTYKAVFNSKYFDQQTITFLEQPDFGNSFNWICLQAQTGQVLFNAVVNDSTLAKTVYSKHNNLIPIYSRNSLFLVDRNTSQITWKSPVIKQAVYPFSDLHVPEFIITDNSFIYQNYNQLIAIDLETKVILWQKILPTPAFKLEYDQYGYVVYDNAIQQLDLMTGELSLKTPLHIRQYEWVGTSSQDTFLYRSLLRDTLFFGILNR